MDFGHTEVINLVSAGSYAEKTVGYLAASVLLKNTDEQITLIVQCIRNDLQSPHDSFQCLALSSIANIGGTELADALAPDVQRLMMSRTTFPVVRKRSTLCMLRLFRVNPEVRASVLSYLLSYAFRLARCHYVYSSTSLRCGV